MYHSILVPLDGSQQAEWALPTAIRLAHAARARISLLAVDLPIPVVTSAIATVGNPTTIAGDSLGEYLKHASERVERSGAVTATASMIEPVTTLSAGHAIAQQARQTNVDLIVMTTHARAVVPRMFLGSVALEVVRWSQVPVLLIKPPAEGTPELTAGALFEHVLVPLDGSSFAEEVLTAAVELGQLGNAEYTLFQAIEPQRIVGGPLEPMVVPVGAAAFDEIEAGARSYLKSVADRLRKRALSVDEKLAIAPSAGEGILHCAQEVGADVIALTTHARGAVTSVLLGSVANHIVRRATVPVLLYRPRGE